MIGITSVQRIAGSVEVKVYKILVLTKKTKGGEAVEYAIKSGQASQ